MPLAYELQQKYVHYLKENHYYDPTKDSWFIPEEWETQEVNDIVNIMNIL